MSSATSVNSALADYAAGRTTAQQLVGVVAAAYYGARDSGLGTRLKPLVEIIERAHPGVIELTGSIEKPGFAVHLAERPFPRRYEAELRQGVEAVLAVGDADVPRPQPRAPSPGFITRIVAAIRNVFSA